MNGFKSHPYGTVSDKHLNGSISHPQSDRCQNEPEPCNSRYMSRCIDCVLNLCRRHLDEHQTRCLDEVQKHRDCCRELQRQGLRLDVMQEEKNALRRLRLIADEEHRRIDEVYEMSRQKIIEYGKDLHHRLEGVKKMWNSNLSDLQKELSRIIKDEQVFPDEISSIKEKLSSLYQLRESLHISIDVKIPEISKDQLIELSSVFQYPPICSNNYFGNPYRTKRLNNMIMFACDNVNNTVIYADEMEHLHLYNSRNVVRHLQFPHSNDDKVVDLKWCSKTKKYLILFSKYLYSYHSASDCIVHIPINPSEMLSFKCVCPFNETSFYICYNDDKTNLELREYPQHHNDNEEVNSRLLNQWNEIGDDQFNCIESMMINSADQIGLVMRRGTTYSTYFTICDCDLNVQRKIEDNEFIPESAYPFRDDRWFIKDMSGAYYIYSSTTGCCNKTTAFRFPRGLQQYEDNSVVIGNENGELQYYDIYQ